MDQKSVLSPTAESSLRRELSLMGADPDDLDRFMAQAQAHVAPIEPTIPDPVSVSSVDAAESGGRFLLQPRPFRLAERISDRVRRPDQAIPVLSV